MDICQIIGFIFLGKSKGSQIAFLNFSPSNSYPKRCYKFKMQVTPSSQSVTIKVVLTLILVIIELIINSFVQASFDLTFQSQFFINFWFLPIQIVVTGFIFIMILILMWQTFPLRYGLIRVLMREFKWTFIVVTIFIAITAAERGIKLNRAVIETNGYSQITNWDDQVYNVLYYIRFILYPLFYAVLFGFCVKIVNPSFYKPSRWLK